MNISEDITIKTSIKQAYEIKIYSKRQENLNLRYLDLIS